MLYAHEERRNNNDSQISWNNLSATLFYLWKGRTSCLYGNHGRDVSLYSYKEVKSFIDSLLKQAAEEIRGVKKVHKEFECGTHNYESFCEDQDCPRFEGRIYNEGLEAAAKHLESL